MEEETMPTGFRFYPTEEELITFYLHNKLQYSLQSTTKSSINRLIPLMDIYQLDPWHLPKHCGEFCRGDTEQWFFFMPKQERQARGGKPSRTTASGYWKATGSLSHVYSADGKVIGVKKTMVFYKGKAPTGTKTKWKMNEYRAIKPDLETSIPRLRDEVSICRIYIVSGSLRAFDRRPVHSSETRAAMDNSVKNKQEKPTNNIIKRSATAEYLPETERSCSSSGTTSTSISGGNCSIDGEMIMIEEWVGNLIESEF